MTVLFQKTPTLHKKLCQHVTPTRNERFFDKHELIVSKTDPKGRITYANSVFLRVAVLSQAQIIGAAHSIIRHPDMPRAVFKKMWDRLAQGREIFAYVKNMASNGDFYWTIAHVTPSRDEQGILTGFHSNRRVPARSSVSVIAELYDKLLKIECGATSRKVGLEKSEQALRTILQERGMEYDKFVFSI